MYNPISNVFNNMPTAEEIKRRVSMQDATFYERMKMIARQRGISEEAINKGMEYIEALRLK